MTGNVTAVLKAGIKDPMIGFKTMQRRDEIRELAQRYPERFTGAGNVHAFIEEATRPAYRPVPTAMDKLGFRTPWGSWVSVWSVWSKYKVLVIIAVVGAVIIVRYRKKHGYVYRAMHLGGTK